MSLSWVGLRCEQNYQSHERLHCCLCHGNMSHDTTWYHVTSQSDSTGQVSCVYWPLSEGECESWSVQNSYQGFHCVRKGMYDAIYIYILSVMSYDVMIWSWDSRTVTRVLLSVTLWWWIQSCTSVKLCTILLSKLALFIGRAHNIELYV